MTISAISIKPKNVGDVIDFLTQFDREAIFVVYPDGDDYFEHVNLCTNPNQDGPWPFPEMVVS